jgi:hypothetical protein
MSESEIHEATPDPSWAPQSHIGKRRRSLVAERLSEVAQRASDERIARMATRMFACADGVRRCKQMLCDACGPRGSARLRKRAEGWLRAVAHADRVVMLTLTTNTSTIDDGRALLLDSFARLRRRDVFASVIAARGQVEVERSVVGAWNVHLHVLVHTAKALRVGALGDAWSELLDGRCAGRVHVMPVPRRWTDDTSTFLGSPRVRVQAVAQAAAGHGRRGASRVRAQRARPEVGVVVRLAMIGGAA